jgi:glycosyltransferase involved in cell wall biosynthesis
MRNLIKWVLQQKKEKATYKRILNSGLFDQEFYTSTYPDVKMAGVDPLLHFIRNGAKERRSPSEAFDLDRYLRDNPIVQFGNENPVIDWLTVGLAGGRIPPCPLELSIDEATLPVVSSEEVAVTLPPSAAIVAVPVEPAAAPVDPVARAKKLVANSGFFDPDYYLASYDDVRRANNDPLDHYIHFGCAENRNPSAEFDTHFYLTQYRMGAGLIPPIETSEKPQALMHFLEKGQKAGLDPRPPGSITLLAAENLTDTCARGLFDSMQYYNDSDQVIAASEESVSNEVAEGATRGAREARVREPGSGLSKLQEPVLDGAADRRDNERKNAATYAPAGVKIAIQLHLFYPEMCELFAVYLNSIERPVDIFVSTTTLANKQFIENCLGRILDREQRVCVSVVENRGRDIAPLIVQFRHIWEDYDYVLHLHSKKSPHAGFGQGWLLWVLRNILGNPFIVEQSLAYLHNNPECAMLFPDNYYEVKKYAGWGGNEGRLSALMCRLGIENFKLPRYAHFPAGTMSWYKASAFRSIMDGRISLEDFDPEAGQVEGTTAHVFERALPLFARTKGYALTTYYVDRPPEPKSIVARHSPALSTDPVGRRWLRDTPEIAVNYPQALAPISRVFNKDCLDISWIIPDFGIGAGGHMTIFRIAELLESFGHRQTFWIQNAFNYPDPIAAKNVIQTHYRKIGDNVCVRFLPDDTRQLSGDVLIATDCWTVFPANTATNFKERFYFIQDYEPYFHPAGDNYMIAESTFSMNLAALCAGEWLFRKATAHGMWARKWDLASDPEFYFHVDRPPKNKLSLSRRDTSPHRIVFYCRTYTPRRAVNLGLAAFEELARRRRDFEVLIFGEHPSDRSYAFPARELGVLAPQMLGELYRKSDVGIAFSTTNYSLVPLEMMACDLPVVEIDAESTRTAFPPGSVAFAAPNPVAVADAIERLIQYPEERTKQIHEARQFVSKLNWKHSARLIEAALIERLEEKGFKSIDIDGVTAPLVKKQRKASVIIPTYNGGRLFREVLTRVASQRCDFLFDVLVVDSSSTDNTAQFVVDFGQNVRLHSIEQSTFQHGRTRNLAISLTDGDIAAVLTQDATPINDKWLANLVDAFEIAPNVAGVFGRHVAYPDHNPFVARDLEHMFGRFADLGPVFSLDQGLPNFLRQGSVDWRLIMHFYSDNNSAMRRSVWNVLPYPEIDWGEDQVWAWEALKLGFTKIYAHDAVVIHSHDFPYAKQMSVGVSEGAMFARYFGYNLHPDGVNPSFLDARTHSERLYAVRNGLSHDSLEDYVKMIRATIEGRYIGATS